MLKIAKYLVFLMYQEVPELRLLYHTQEVSEFTLILHWNLIRTGTLQ